jgi:hypothetical protein
LSGHSSYIRRERPIMIVFTTLMIISKVGHILSFSA